MGTHENSWVLMDSQWVLVGSHGFSVGTRTVHFWVLRGFSGRHPPSDELQITGMINSNTQFSSIEVSKDTRYKLE